MGLIYPVSIVSLSEELVCACAQGRCSLLLLLLLSRFSHVRLFATPQTAAHQAPLSLGFSRQEHQSGLPFPSPMHESGSGSEVTQSCQTLSDPMDCSLPGSSVHGIVQARVLEWGAIAFSRCSLRWSFYTLRPRGMYGTEQPSCLSSAHMDHGQKRAAESHREEAVCRGVEIG